MRRDEAFRLTFTDGEVETRTKPCTLNCKFSLLTMFVVWYKQIFKGSVNDDFCLGITLHNGQLELMSPLHTSDIIIATPVGVMRNNTNNR